MKKLLLTLSLLIGVFTNAFSQATSLTVDCQTPGWLSSYLDPTVATNITDLKVLGSLNKEDFKVIGKLMKNYKLNGKLDLSEITIVGSKGNYFSGDMFGVTGCRLSYLSLPYSLTDMEKVLSFGFVETLEVGGDKLPNFYILSYLGGSYSSVTLSHLIIREGTEKLELFKVSGNGGNDNSCLESIKLPESMLYICGLGNGFNNLSSINTPKNVLYLGSLVGTKVYFNEETYYVPSSVTTFWSGWVNDGYLGEGGIVKELYLPAGLETFWLNNINYKATISIHIKSKIAPNINNTSSISLEKCVIYVPQGYEEVYRNAGTWKNASIIGEVYAEDISIIAPYVYKGDDVVFNATVTPNNTTFKNVIWESSDNNIITIDNNGKAFGNECGTTKITAYSSDKGCCSTADVTVYEHTTGIIVNQEQVLLDVGAKTILEAHTLPLDLSDNRFFWKSDNPDVATIDADGVVQAKGKGSCSIIATSIDGGFIAECKVVVKQPVIDIYLNTKEKNLEVGETYTLIPTVIPNNADNKNIIWTSDNLEIATVEDGKISAIKAGVVKITATSEDNENASDYCEVTVTQPTSGITLNYSLYTLNTIGATVQLEATIYPEDASNKEINWNSSNENVCVVSNGMVVAVGYGTSVIIATTVDGGFLATCVVNVEDTSAIQEATIGNQDDYPIYDMMGCKVKKVIKGRLYIQNGQKFIAN